MPSLLQSALRKVQSDGIIGLLSEVYRRAVPRTLDGFPQVALSVQHAIGLEIGGPSSFFRNRGRIPVYALAARVDNCNFDHLTVWEGKVREGDTFVFDRSRPPGRQYVSEATNLAGIADGTYDFLLSSHCVEHLANPLQGLAEWTRVLKNDGLLILVCPHKDGTFDHRRPVTTLEHLVQDFRNRTGEGDMTHLDEILKLHDLSMDPAAGDFAAFRDRSRRNRENRCLHHHVFDTFLAVEMVNHAGLQILAVEVLRPYDIVIISRKVGGDRDVDNDAFRGVRSAPCWRSPFPSDRYPRESLGPRG